MLHSTKDVLFTLSSDKLALTFFFLHNGLPYHRLFCPKEKRDITVCYTSQSTGLQGLFVHTWFRT